MYIVGITGPIGHGKSTFANLLSSVEPKSEQMESASLISEITNAWFTRTQSVPQANDVIGLNAWVQLLVPLVQQHLETKCRPEQLEFTQEHIDTQPEQFTKLLQFVAVLNADPILLNTPITAENKEQFRPILQWLGGYLPNRIDSSIWYREIVRRIHANTSGAVLYIVSGLRYPADGQIIQDASGTVVKLSRPQFEERDLEDPTERQRHNIRASVEVINNGSLDDLLHVAQAFYKDLINSSLQTRYQAVATTDQT